MWWIIELYFIFLDGEANHKIQRAIRDYRAWSFILEIRKLSPRALPEVHSVYHGKTKTQESTPSDSKSNVLSINAALIIGKKMGFTVRQSWVDTSSAFPLTSLRLLT